MTCARRGVSLEQRTHRPVMFQSFFCYLALRSQQLEDAAHRADARNCAQRHRPVAFVTEGLRLVLCFASTAESGFKKTAGQPLALTNASTPRLRPEDSCQRWRTALASIGAVDRSLQSKFS